MEKNFMTNLIPEEVYGKWIGGKKVIIQGPTGIGKSYFFEHDFSAYCKRRGKRVAIVCNRKMLKNQYRFDLAGIYARHADMEECIGLFTYQQLAEMLKQGYLLESILKDFDVIICDECHYFYSDSDFNGYGTYVLLQALVQASFYKTMIFVSATMREVLPLIEKTLIQCEQKMRVENPVPQMEKYCYQGEIHDFNYLADYSRFVCHFVADMESLAAVVATSEKKTMMFIDDITMAQSMKSMLEDNFAVPKDQVKLINSHILDENPNDSKLKEIFVANKFSAKILITTSVLDNGVSIKDPEVENLIIATESRVSFIQMIGRIRCEKSRKIKLYIFPRPTSYYEKRSYQYEEKIEKFKRLSNVNLHSEYFEYLAAGWYGNDAEAEFIRSAIVQTTDKNEYYTRDFTRSTRIIYLGAIMAINAFAMEKVGNMAQAEMRFLSCSYKEDGTGVAREQIRWLGKSPNELVVVKSTYKEERESLLKQMLLEINEYTNEMLQEAKKSIALEFRANILKEMNLPADSFDTKKLKTICERYNLEFKQTTDAEKKAIYSINLK